MVIWKNVEFRNKGIIVDKTPTISKAQKRIEQFVVPYRNGFLSVDSGVYDSFVVQVECHAKEDADFDEIKAFLDGYGTLSFDGEREYTAIIKNAIEFSKAHHFKRFPVQFEVNPIAYDIIPSTFSGTGTLTINDATTEMFPTITIVASGDVSMTINNNTFYLDDADGTYILDCQNKVITKNGVNAANIMRGDFPTLQVGTNTISSTGTATITTEYKKAYL